MKKEIKKEIEKTIVEKEVKKKVKKKVMSKYEDNIYLWYDTNVWIKTLEWEKIQLTKGWWIKWICAQKWLLTYSNPVLSDDFKYALMTLNCENETPEIYVKEIETMKSEKISYWTRAYFIEFDGDVKIEVDGLKLHNNPFLQK